MKNIGWILMAIMCMLCMLVKPTMGTVLALLILCAPISFYRWLFGLFSARKK